MADYRKVELLQFPKTQEHETPEARYWSKFKTAAVVKQFAPITSVACCATEPHDTAVTTGTRVIVLSGTTHEVLKQFTKFKEPAYSGRLRRDGTLLLAGSESSVVKVFTASSRTLLRSLKGHKRAVHATMFSTDNVHIVSASDDRTVAYWDLPTGGQLASMRGHKDYVRTLAQSPSDHEMFVSGSYDHTVRLWDMRTQGTSGHSGKSVLAVDHGAPVEAVLVLPGGSVLLSAGGDNVKLWDVLGGGRLLHTFSNHQKTVTSLCVDGSGQRLLSAGLDHHLKMYDLRTHTVTHGIKFPAPVLAMDIAPDNSSFTVGMADGTVLVRHREQQADALPGSQANTKLRGGTYKFFIRGKNAAPAPDDYRVETARKPRLQRFDKFLRRFQYHNALDAALATNDAVAVVSLLHELGMRNGLEIALSGRDDVTLQPVLVFLVRHIANPRYSALLIDVANTVFDLYAKVIGHSVAVDEQFSRLRAALARELALQKRMQCMLGTLDALLAAADGGRPGADEAADGGAAGVTDGGAGAGSGDGAAAGAGAAAAGDSAASAPAGRVASSVPVGLAAAAGVSAEVQAGVLALQLHEGAEVAVDAARETPAATDELPLAATPSQEPRVNGSAAGTSTRRRGKRSAADAGAGGCVGASSAAAAAAAAAAAPAAAAPAAPAPATAATAAAPAGNGEAGGAGKKRRRGSEDAGTAAGAGGKAGKAGQAGKHKRKGARQ